MLKKILSILIIIVQLACAHPRKEIVVTKYKCHRRSSVQFQFDRPGVDRDYARKRAEFETESDSITTSDSKVTDFYFEACSNAGSITVQRDAFIGRIFSPDDNVSVWITAEELAVVNANKSAITKEKVRDIAHLLESIKDKLVK